MTIIIKYDENYEAICFNCHTYFTEWYGITKGRLHDKGITTKECMDEAVRKVIE